MKPHRIMIIDDDPMQLQLLSGFLESEGYDVEKAWDGEEGLRLFNENPHDLVITDIMMPNKSGIAVVMELTKKYPDVKIVTITGELPGDQQDFLRMTKILGASVALRKPLVRNSLLRAVEDSLKE